MNNNGIDEFDEIHIKALVQAIESSDICIFYQTTDLIYRWAKNVPDFLLKKWQANCRDNDFLSTEIAERLETKKLQVLATGECTTTEVSFEEQDKHIWYKFSIDAYKDKQGKTIGLIMTGVNVSEIKQREQVLKVLLRELSHRSKNLLAIIQSIASQTARFSDTTSMFLKKFQGRIQSLSHSQDLITNSNWSGASFHELIRLQTSLYLGTESHRFTIVGDNPYLFPNAALHVGLAIHELLINSLSFGAMAQEKGTVAVSCNKQVDPNNEVVVAISWNEKFDPAGILPEDPKSCFGSAVLEKIVPASLSGNAVYHIDNYGVLYIIKMPQGQFEFR